MGMKKPIRIWVMTIAGCILFLGGSIVRAEDDELLKLIGGTGAAGTAVKTDASRLKGVIAAPTAEQTIFLSYFDRGEMDKALLQWPSAFEGGDFAKSETGLALQAYLLFTNGLKTFATERLLLIESPERVDAAVVKMWQEAAPDESPVWSAVNPKMWKNSWRPIFGANIEARVRARQVFSSQNVDEIKELLKLSSRSSQERAWLQWQLVLAEGGGGDTATAAQVLALLMKADRNPIGSDLMTLTAARLLYQNGYLDAAIKYDEKVPKDADDWFDAQEEMAWAYLRKGEPQNALAVTKTLATAAFAPLIGPEALFVRALAQLKVCDYPGVVSSLELFRNRFRERARILAALSEASDSPDVQALVAKLKLGRARLTDLGATGARLPRFVTRDEPLAQAIAAGRTWAEESARASELTARALSGGTLKIGMDGSFERFRQAIETRKKDADSAAVSRVKDLAKEEVQEIAQILQKMHIVEAELLSQVSVSGKLAKAVDKSKIEIKKGSTGVALAGRDRISFPEEKEIWFDELAHYQVDLQKSCQVIKR